MEAMVTTTEVEFGGGRLACAPGEATVADAMIHRPKLLPASATVRDVHDFFRNDHVHAALVADGDMLLTVIGRDDLSAESGDRPAAELGALLGRTVEVGADLWSTWAAMTDARRRRLAVVDDGGRCVGLLCLKRSQLGFCCDAGVWARARARLA
ncbi:CBS domain-containing protein [Nocardioides sp. CCNWLW239]|uniref:CBS domain-containing protein n=1 Tax=Nocardioides sp. CCNWLW239 TaxID=3128902 RepID=UPI00301B39B0